MNKKMLKLFLYWMKERETIYRKRSDGKGWPWTADPILQQYKFTNVFRQNDAVTKELAKVLNRNDTIRRLYEKIIIFRMFNWPATYHALDKKGLVKNWNTRKAIFELSKRKASGEKVFTGAYIITNNGKTEDKIVLVCNAIGDLLHNEGEIILSIRSERSIERAVDILSDYDMVGGFIGYELATDMRHTKILSNARDILTWANPGPGAKRGMHRILFNTERGELPKDRYEKLDYQDVMQNLRVEAQTQLANEYPFEKVTFEMRDIEHSLCEFDKYMRVKNGEGRPRSKYQYRGE